MAIIVTLQFKASTLNSSLQVGDMVYYSEIITASGGFQTTGTPKLLGEVKTMTVDEVNDNIAVRVLDSITPSGGSAPFTGLPYFSFSKSGKANHNDLIGYYNEVKFVNNSKDKAKLFAVGTEATENSK